MGEHRGVNQNHQEKEVSVNRLMDQFGLDEPTLYKTLMAYLRLSADKGRSQEEVINQLRDTPGISDLSLDYFSILGMSIFLKKGSVGV